MLSAPRRQFKFWVRSQRCQQPAGQPAGTAPTLPLPPTNRPHPALLPITCAGSFWGTTFRPGDVLDLEIDQMEALLAATSGNLLSDSGSSSSSSNGPASASAGASKVLDDALFAHAESVSNRFFGKDVYYRGIVEFSNVRVGQARPGQGRAGQGRGEG